MSLSQYNFPSDLSPRDRRPEALHQFLDAFRLDSWVKQRIEQDLPRIR
jgi:hypothetical protein